MPSTKQYNNLLDLGWNPIDISDNVDIIDDIADWLKNDYKYCYRIDRIQVYDTEYPLYRAEIFTIERKTDNKIVLKVVTGNNPYYIFSEFIDWIINRLNHRIGLIRNACDKLMITDNNRYY